MKNKITKVEEHMWQFIDKHKFIIFFALVTIIALLVRLIVINYESRDYTIFLKPWFDELKANGGINALKLDIGNYNAPYMTILAILTYLPIKSLYSIKAVSIIFDYVLALGVYKIVYILLKENENRKNIALIFYSVVLMLPTVILNSACWAQADSIYVAFIILSIAYLLEEKYIKSFILLGISFAFKLQFIFILPLYILVYISKRNFSILNFFIIPITNAIMCLPSILCGKSVASCINVYINQAGLNADKLSMNFPSIYNLFVEIKGANFAYAPNEFIDKVGMLITFFVFVIIAFIVLYKQIKFDNEKIINFGLWSVVIATFLLPHMHDRYLYLGDILSLIYLIYNRDKLYIPIAIELMSLYCYSRFLFGGNKLSIQFLSIVYLIVFIDITRNIYLKYINKQKSGQSLERGVK